MLKCFFVLLSFTSVSGFAIAQTWDIRLCRFYMVDESQNGVLFDFFMLPDSSIIDGEFLRYNNAYCANKLEKHMVGKVFDQSAAMFSAIKNELESRELKEIHFSFLDSCEFDIFVQELSFRSDDIQFYPCYSERVSPITNSKNNNTLSVLGSLEFLDDENQRFILPRSFYSKISKILCAFMKNESVGAYGVD